MTSRPREICTGVFSAIALLVTASCGNAVTAEVNGMTGVTLGENGRVVIVVAICSDSVDQVGISLGREGLKDSEPNVQVGTWTLRKPATKTATLDTVKPGPEWKAHKPVELIDGLHYIVDGSKSGTDVVSIPVDFRLSDLESLRPGQVHVDGDVWLIDEFEKKACTRVNS